MRKISRLFLVLLIALPILCSYANESYEVAQTLPASIQFETDHYIFRLYDDLVVSDVSDIVKGLDDNYDRIINDLAPDHVPKTYVHLFGDKETWLKINPMMPDGGGTVTREHGTDNIWMFVWNDKEFDVFIAQIQTIKKSIDSKQLRSFLNLTLNAIHEFTHLVMVSVDERIANNPRWLWESVALYEARQSFDPVKNGYSLEEIQIPFSDLEQSFHLYMLGYHITDYIVSKWGLSLVRQLIKVQGDTQQILNISLEEFEKDFWRYMNCKYYEKSSCR